LRHVDELGLRERTIVVYQSDHGHSTEERAHFGGGNSGPYRGAKFSMFEGGIRVPGLIAWPGHLPAGAVRGQVVSSCDWLPTLAELCGVKVLNPDLDGRSVVKVLRAADAPSAHDVLHWHEPVVATSGAAAGKSDRWAVRQGDWKLLANVWDTSKNDKGSERIPLFLANLAEDVGEKQDYAKDRPEVVARLRGMHEEWVAKV
jgi:arylsulfatase A